MFPPANHYTLCFFLYSHSLLYSYFTTVSLLWASLLPVSWMYIYLPLPACPPPSPPASTPHGAPLAPSAASREPSCLTTFWSLQDVTTAACPYCVPAVDARGAPPPPGVNEHPISLGSLWFSSTAACPYCAPPRCGCLR